MDARDKRLKALQAAEQNRIVAARTKNLEDVALGPQLNRPEHAVHCHCLAGTIGTPRALSVFRDGSQRPDP